MKKSILLIALIGIIASCANTTKEDNSSSPGVIITVDELISNPDAYIDKEVKITGLVTHVCKHGGQKLFVAGSDEGITLRVNTSDNIPEFKLDMEGSTCSFTGVVKQMDEEFLAQTLAEEKEHHGEDAEDCEHSVEKPKQVYVVASAFENN